MSACAVKWCVLQPADDDALCAVHRKHPVLPNESWGAWQVRIGRSIRDAERRARQIAAQDARDAKRTP